MPTSGRQESVVDREAFGLTAQKPSEMVAGLDEVAKRAERIEAREEAKRKAGGRMSANIGLHVDEVGYRWKKRVNIGIAAAVTLTLVALALMLYSTVNPRLDPREGNAEAQKMLSSLAALAKGSGLLKEGETITAEEARKRLQEEVEVQYQKVLDDIARNHKKNHYKTPDPGLAKDRETLEKLRLFQDPWGQPFIFVIDGDTLKISAIGKKTPSGAGPEPVTIPLRSRPAAPLKKAQ